MRTGRAMAPRIPRSCRRAEESTRRIESLAQTSSEWKIRLRAVEGFSHRRLRVDDRRSGPASRNGAATVQQRTVCCNSETLAPPYARRHTHDTRHNEGLALTAHHTTRSPQLA